MVGSGGKRQFSIRMEANPMTVFGRHPSAKFTMGVSYYATTNVHPLSGLFIVIRAGRQAAAAVVVFCCRITGQRCSGAATVTANVLYGPSRAFSPISSASFSGGKAIMWRRYQHSTASLHGRRWDKMHLWSAVMEIASINAIFIFGNYPRRWYPFYNWIIDSIDHPYLINWR